MALNNSGPLSFGGATVGQSINLELGVSATAEASINSTAFRTLAGVASGAISLNNFYGKSTAPTVIGQAFGGGYYAGQIGVSSVATHYLIVGPISSAYNSSLKFKDSNTTDPGALSVINGPANSASMNDATHPAAQFCEGLTIGGFSDWYLPAINEVEVCYFNLKPTTNSNYTGGAEPMGWPNGSNPNAVPSRSSAYTSGTPAQTSATIFRTGNAEAFPTGSGYWSSTQSADPRPGYARCTNFEIGYQYNQPKGHPNYSNRRVRAIRRVAV